MSLSFSASGQVICFLWKQSWLSFSLMNSEAKCLQNDWKHTGNKHLYIAANCHPLKPNLFPSRSVSGFSSAEPAKILWSRWQFSICCHGWQLSVLRHSQVTRQMVGCWKCCWIWSGSYPALFGPDELVQVVQHTKRGACLMSTFLCGRTVFFSE